MTEFPTENHVDALGFLLTRFCPAACAHCGSNSSPDERGWLDVDLAQRMFNEAKHADIRSILFSGGEPLARFDHGLAMITAAHAVGLEVSVCTNASWARDYSRSKHRVQQLHDAGVTTLLLSTDRWHLEFIPLDAVRNAAIAAQEAGITVQISVPSGIGDWTAISLAGKLQAETGSAVISHPVHPVGRGASLPLSVVGITPPDLGGCHLAGHLEVDFDGTVSICPTSAEFGTSSPLVLGNASSQPLDSLIEQYRRTPWHAVIRLFGPLGAHLLAGGDPGLNDRSPQAPQHPCHLCREVNNGTATAQRASEQLNIDLLHPQEPNQFRDSLLRAAERIGAALQPTDQLVEIR